jgi:NAD(P)-dependent dehydrogenase (short-subunit alcohol dehydrogenase family)
MSLRGQVIVVTGAGSGLGRAAAAAWAAAHATVVLVGRRREWLRAVASEILAAGGEAHALPADLTSAADIERLRAFLDDVAGRVDLLFNGAGAAHPPTPLLELADETFDAVLAINLRAVWRLTRALVPLLAVRRGSQVLNLTSGLKAAPGYGAYSISKSALDSLSQILAAELAPLGIRVNTFNPGLAPTAMAPEAPVQIESLLPSLVELAAQSESGPSGLELTA